MTDTELQEKVIDIVIEEKIPNFKLNKYETIGMQTQRAKIKALMALINQSNREYCNGIIGEDEEKGDHESTRTNIELYERNNLRAELRKKNATPLEDKG